MGSVAVGKLKLRCETHQRDRFRFAIEDGLRTALPDERRLVLLRRMRVAGAIASPAQRDEAVRSGWLAAVAGARHGEADGAADANCVWFESREEAESLLLARLLAGRLADGWYWRLAVPEWRGQPVEPWLRQSLARALVESDDQRVLAIADACIAAGQADRLLQSITEAGHGQPDAVPGRGWAPPTASPPAGRAGIDARDASNVAPPAWLSLPPRLEAAVARLVRGPGDARAAARAMLRAWALRRSPALALAPRQLAATVTVLIERMRGPEAARPARAPPAARPAKPSQTRPIPAPEARPTVKPTAARSGTKESARPRTQDPSPTAPEPAEAPAPREALAPAEPFAFRRWRHSDHAGLWLVLPSLVQLGFPEWLAARPELLSGHPAALLLQAIARRHRVRRDDPALLVLPPLDEGPLPGWTELWSKGLDRWLRRAVRRRLHDLLRRAGELDWDEHRLEILFPAKAVDIALRRRALDRDPGWTDWLGLSVRYHFGGEFGWL